MCTVSMIGEHYGDQIKTQWPQLHSITTSPGLDQHDLQRYMQMNPSPVTRDEFEALKKTVNEMVVLLRKAKKYDEEHNEPECEIEEKMATLRKVAKLVGVDLDAEMRKAVSQ